MIFGSPIKKGDSLPLTGKDGEVRVIISDDLNDGRMFAYVFDRGEWSIVQLTQPWPNSICLSQINDKLDEVLALLRAAIPTKGM